MVAVGVASRRRNWQRRSFEPNPANIMRLRRTIELNRLTNVTVREVALSDEVGDSEFFLSDSSSMGSLVSAFATRGVCNCPNEHG